MRTLVFLAVLVVCVACTAGALVVGAVLDEPLIAVAGLPFLGVAYGAHVYWAYEGDVRPWLVEAGAIAAVIVVAAAVAAIAR